MADGIKLALNDQAVNDRLAQLSRAAENPARAMRGRLIGFVTPGSADPIEHVSGELLKTKNGTVWWEEVFGAASYLEEQP
ncbi:hypothetical protein EN932_27085 [Mesorhizobium sp. M7A.F.Ca.US.002.01.1.1]|uniref:phage tail terminator protein n=1 Tax=Mesorhizobium sp. M7A.F.Ca.US.002.01.1.1 TaxID=2496700 RepID=UPI000FD199E1|nr:hypothetical protein [Mesorhizobium sp. M7A.F.Ca.US.002.01.1.1]RVA07641.1 hypothetical protein EN932_27085 [Mesorhizobium sp. M7A.F.Ca.US.002.01.1.1]